MLRAPGTAATQRVSLVPPLLGGVPWRKPSSSALARSMEPGHGSGALADMDGRGTWHYLCRPASWGMEHGARSPARL